MLIAECKEGPVKQNPTVSILRHHENIYHEVPISESCHNSLGWNKTRDTGTEMHFWTIFNQHHADPSLGFLPEP